jgi:hypothetical protein
MMAWVPGEILKTTKALLDERTVAINEQALGRIVAALKAGPVFISAHRIT